MRYLDKALRASASAFWALEEAGQEGRTGCHVSYTSAGFHAHMTCIRCLWLFWSCFGWLSFTNFVVGQLQLE